MKKSVLVLMTLSIIPVNSFASASKDWRKTLSCDGGAVVVDELYGKTPSGDSVPTGIRQAVIHDSNIIEFFHSREISDPTPGQDPGYYDGIHLKGLLEYPGVMIFIGNRITNDNGSVAGATSVKLASAPSHASAIQFSGNKQGEGFLFRLVYTTPKECFQDSDGYPVCYGGESKVANWFFRHCE